jgi:hypothetical protein
MLPNELLRVRFLSRVLRTLGLVGASLDQPDRGEDEEGELQVLGLPVLHDGLAEVRRDDVAGIGDRRLAVGPLLVVERPVARDGLAEERRGEEDPEDE